MNRFQRIIINITMTVVTAIMILWSVGAIIQPFTVITTGIIVCTSLELWYYGRWHMSDFRGPEDLEDDDPE